MGRSRSRTVTSGSAGSAAPGRRRAGRPRRDDSAGAPEGLREYRRKRDFALTPEPAGGAAPPRAAGDRMFVIQKHAATRLHYDFRLELEGTLKSWAVPKGPSLDPQDKRLAMHVEDHPIEYAAFEGIIPKGEYGGGTVLLWDRGTWQPEEDPHKGYHGGNLKFSLHGDKLRGSWALVRIKGGRNPRDDGRSWLLIKHRDAEAKPADRYSVVDARPESVATGRTLEEIASAADRVWHSNRFDGPSEAGGATKASSAARASGAARTSGGARASGAARHDNGAATVHRLAVPAPARAAAALARAAQAAAPSAADIPGSVAAALPAFLPPQLATLVTAAPVGEQWLHEMKFDGYRILARLDQGRAQLYSRNGRDWTDHFATVARAVGRLPARRALLDGEVAMLLPDGTTSFQALQNAGAEAERGHLVYMVFDLLHLDGRDLTGAALEDRKRALAQLVAGAGATADPVRYSDHVVGEGPEFFAQACRLGLEGIVSKRRDAPYRGARGQDWLKVKCLRRQEVVIGGYTDPEGSRVGIGALLAGVYDGRQLVYAGKVGTGFSDRSLRDLTARLRKLEQDTSPFASRPAGVPRAHWVKPELVAEVAFSEWTADGRMRHPSFQGLREDKPAEQVVRERAASPREVEAAEPRARAGTSRSADAPASSARKPAAATPAPSAGRVSGESRRGVVAEVAGVTLTHADRVLYSVHRTTKVELAHFYEAIADWILPHLKDRPTTLVRCPDGVDGKCFYQKHTGYWAPPSIRRVKIREKTKTGEYLVIDTLAALVGLVQIGILEIHTWNSLVADLEHPDRVVLDLDPAPDVEWRRVVEAARDVRERLSASGLESFVKTTGGKGLHVVAPIGPGATWERSAAFARGVAEAMAREEPRAYLASMAKAERTGRIFVDYLRNVRGATSVAAYSTRAKPNAPVSVPLAWDELTPRLRSDRFTIATVRERLAGLRADPWRRYWTVRQRLPGGASA